mmetsp:Transcript_22577/g.49007  ORF Transcript_22577/g.49007 Transcript_22577/m.49007 type:complete len:187 (+) Transcript_22577:43-603(+)
MVSRTLSVALSRAGGRSGRGGPRSRSSTRPKQAQEVNGSAAAADTIISAHGTSGTSARMRRPKFAEDLPSLKEFVHQQTVIRQYRGFLRAVSMIPDPAFQRSSVEEVRTTFLRYKDETDVMAIQMAVREGERQLEKVRSMVGYVDPRSREDDDSWLNIQDEDDPRGRVGMQWPWQQKDDDAIDDNK